MALSHTIPVLIAPFFAWARHHFGLEAAYGRGMTTAYQHTAFVYTVMSGVALTTHRFRRPELAGSRVKLSAVKTLP